MNAARQHAQALLAQEPESQPAHLSLAAYWDQLNAHDWWYAMSDDHRVYTRGSGVHDGLWQLSKLSAAHAQLFAGFAAHYDALKSGAALPARPLELVAA